MVNAVEVVESSGICRRCGREAILGDGLCVDCWEGKRPILEPNHSNNLRGRPRTGELVDCAGGCGKALYIYPYRMMRQSGNSFRCMECYRLSRSRK